MSFSEEDMDKVKEKVEKCLTVIGFTKSENVSQLNLNELNITFIVSIFHSISSFFACELHPLRFQANILLKRWSAGAHLTNLSMLKLFNYLNLVA